MSPNRLSSFPLRSAEGIREILAKRVDQQRQATGIVVGVIDPNGRRVAGYGKLAKDDPRSVDGNTIFEIGSLSKIFTALLLADMVDRKEVALEDPAAEYLPRHVTLPERGGKSITLLDLATHRSGLPRLPGNLKPRDLRNPYADYLVEDLYQFLSGYALPRDPGSEFEYSNLGGGLLGHVLANRAGTNYDSLIRSRIAEPLGMRDTGVTLSSSMRERMATGHNAMLAPVPNWDLPTLGGAGALRSSANDMLTFLEAFAGYKEPALRPAMEAMLEVRRPAGQIEIGLGWLITPVEGSEIAWHNGGTGGFRAFAGYDRSARTGVVSLSNAFTPLGVDDIGFHLLNPKLRLANPEPPKEHAEVAIDPVLFDQYTGRYQVTPNLILEITREDGRLFGQAFVQMPQNPSGNPMAAPKFELFAEGETKFFTKVNDRQIAFETGGGGRATRLILSQTGRPDMSGERLS